MPKAIALLSGGLDSTLAILTILRQGVEVNAIRFVTPFDCSISQPHLHFSFLKGERGGGVDFQHPYKEMDVSQKFGFVIEIYNLGNEFLEIVKNPPHGYGKNMNPCIDCRIIMLTKAKLYMDKIGADFIVTGEVLGQRSMSQRKNIFYLVDSEAKVTDYVLRPLSAKLLKITFPEMNGIINREMLYDFNGRSRKPQIALAKEIGLTDYPAPAGGCLLTEPNYAHRLKDLLAFDPYATIKDIELLKVGRHFRFSPACKIIVGRNKLENETIESLVVNSDHLVKVKGYGSPTTLVTGEISDEALRVAASLCARYSDAKNLSEVEVSVSKNDFNYLIKTQPAHDDLVREYRVELNKPAGKQITNA